MSREETGLDEATDGAGWRSAFWRRELPYLAILALTAIGAGYVSMTRQSIVHYWDVMAVLVCAHSIFVGWKAYDYSKDRWRLIWTQVLHWAAFLVAMNLVFVPSVQAVLTADSSGLVVLFLLALGTFVGGVHMGSVRTCLNGMVMAVLVPAIAWLDQSALLISLVLLVALGIGAAVLYHRMGRGDA